MSMRIALAAFALAALAAAASATPNWKGAGWYVVADTIYGPMVDSGPYASQEACAPHLSPADDEADYACEYLAAQPTWDT